MAQEVKCAALECKPPFQYKSPADAGTCCPVCWSEEVKVPEDRSWAEGLSGGVGPDPNADQTLCRGVVCLKPDCPEFEQVQQSYYYLQNTAGHSSGLWLLVADFGLNICRILIRSIIIYEFRITSYLSM